MFDPQHLEELQESSGLIGDPNSWLSGQQQQSTSTTVGNGSLDRGLFNDLVEMVPLVQSLIEHQKKNTSFTRRGSIICTKTPVRKSLNNKTKAANDPKGKNAQSITAKKIKDQPDKNSQDGDDFSILSSMPLSVERDELVALREQVEDLKKKLAEKDELLILAEMSKNQVNDINAKLDELKRQAVEKDSLLKSTQLQLSDAKIKLADKQAAVEKLHWEAMTSNSKVEKLQGELESVQGDISSFMHLFEGLTKDDSTFQSEDYEVKPYQPDSLCDIDELDDSEMQQLEEARQIYIAAVVAAKAKQDEESIANAVRARLNLQSFVFRSKSMNSGNDFSSGGIQQARFHEFVH
ncbi:hypothetical protein ACFE04_006280 [Oxalis oulophora]